jgi:hypothetical protein
VAIPKHDDDKLRFIVFLGVLFFANTGILADTIGRRKTRMISQPNPNNNLLASNNAAGYQPMNGSPQTQVEETMPIEFTTKQAFTVWIFRVLLFFISLFLVVTIVCVLSLYTKDGKTLAVLSMVMFSAPLFVVIHSMGTKPHGNTWALIACGIGAIDMAVALCVLCASIIPMINKEEGVFGNSPKYCCLSPHYGATLSCSDVYPMGFPATFCYMNMDTVYSNPSQLSFDWRVWIVLAYIIIAFVYFVAMGVLGMCLPNQKNAHLQWKGSVPITPFNNPIYSGMSSNTKYDYIFGVANTNPTYVSDPRKVQ